VGDLRVPACLLLARIDGRSPTSTDQWLLSSAVHYDRSWPIPDMALPKAAGRGNLSPVSHRALSEAKNTATLAMPAHRSSSNWPPNRPRVEKSSLTLHFLHFLLGALQYWECVGDDVKPGKVTSYPQSVRSAAPRRDHLVNRSGHLESWRS
jgi:hypothetical protein